MCLSCNLLKKKM